MTFFLFGVLVTLLALNIHSLPMEHQVQSSSDLSDELPKPNSAPLEKSASENGPNPDIAGENGKEKNENPPIGATGEKVFTGFLSAQIDNEMALNADDVNTYLIRYGYLKTPANNSISMQDTEVAIRKFQQFARLKQTGVMDTATHKKMESPRCGMVDRSPDEHVHNFKFNGKKWTKMSLTYKITKYTNKLYGRDVRSTFRKTFDMWSAVSPLKFTEVYYGTADIIIEFGYGNHGDKFPFDGKGTVLAHAFFPEDGRIHFDEAEDWTLRSKSGTNLWYVALHEFGHAIGLQHSDADSVMQPFYPGYDPNLKLKADDIKGIQTLYKGATSMGNSPNPDIAGKNGKEKHKDPPIAATGAKVFTGFQSAQIDRDMTLNADDVNTYLIRYGYLKTPANNSISMQDTEVAIRKFQQFARLKQTGVMDTATHKKMESPRCGMVDRSPDEHVHNFKFNGKKWTKMSLTYKITKYTYKLNGRDVRSTFRKTFDMWSAVSPLKFTEVYYGTADIIIEFGYGNHGDKFPFDGKGTVLAHAFFPEDGRIHFDEAEDWTVRSKSGTNLWYVALHEFGHAIGLQHSDADSVMQPFYPGYDPNLKLKADDIKGIQTLYKGATSMGNSPNPDIAGKNGKEKHKDPPIAATGAKVFTGFQSAQIDRDMTLNADDVNTYLIRYGYLKTPANNSISMQDTEVAIRKFQQFARLKQTGVMDTATHKKMESPRCGMVDRSPDEHVHNFKFNGKKWRKMSLTYKITKYTDKLYGRDVRSTFRKTFDMWSAVSPLNFTEVYYGTADIIIEFVYGNHGDKSPFDGKGTVLAHASFPEDGRVHFDEAEDWTLRSKSGTNLWYVALHEFGHAIGLQHSDADSVMQPFYPGYDPNLKLKADDIKGIRTLYGIAETKITPKREPTTPKTPVVVPSMPFPCPFRYEAIMLKGGATYVFKGSLIYLLDNNGIATTPSPISDVFPGGPRKVFAAAHSDDIDKTFLFYGYEVYRFTKGKLDDEFPKTINSIVDSATVIDEWLIGFSMSSVVYMDYDIVNKVDFTLKKEYPKLPPYVGAAISYESPFIYFFHRNRIYKMDYFDGKMTNMTCS